MQCVTTRHTHTIQYDNSKQHVKTMVVHLFDHKPNSFSVIGTLRDCRREEEFPLSKQWGVEKRKVETMVADHLRAIDSRFTGAIESAVQAEIDGMPGIELKFPGLVAMARGNAAAIDRDDQPQLRATLTQTVMRLLKELRVESASLTPAMPTVQQQFMMKLVEAL